MLDLSRKAKTTDPRDKVYGLMGLMPSEVADRIQPDYSLTLGEVYISFAKAWITASCSLELLEQCTSPNTSLPSWVPDWTNTNHFRLYSGRSTYHATLSEPPVCRFNPGSTVLLAKGIKLGEIDGLGASYYEDRLATTSEDALVQPTESVSVYGNGQDLRQAVWQTLTGNRTPKGKVAPNTYQCLLQCPITLEDEAQSQSRGRMAFSHLLRQDKDLRVAGQALGSFLPATSKSDPDGSKDALERVFRFHRTRRLAITAQGHLGVVPIAARRGDEIFLLLGCNVPMVLRCVEKDRHQVIGLSARFHGRRSGTGSAGEAASMDGGITLGVRVSLLSNSR